MDMPLLTRSLSTFKKGQQLLSIACWSLYACTVDTGLVLSSRPAAKKDVRFMLHYEDGVMVLPAGRESEAQAVPLQGECYLGEGDVVSGRYWLCNTEQEEEEDFGGSEEEEGGEGEEGGEERGDVGE